MNVYTGLLFLHGHIADARLAASFGQGFGQSYGNRVASERLLRERWEPGEREPAGGREDDIGGTPRAA